MKRNLLLALASLLLGTASAFAQNTLNIHQKTGGIISYSFSEKPVVTCTDDGIHLVTNSVEVDYPLSNLEKFTFEDGIAPTDIISTHFADGKSSPIKVYNTNGILIRTLEPSDDGSVEFPLRDLPVGVYIIKNSTTTYKLIKK